MKYMFSHEMYQEDILFLVYLAAYTYDIFYLCHYSYLRNTCTFDSFLC